MSEAIFEKYFHFCKAKTKTDKSAVLKFHNFLLVRLKWGVNVVLYMLSRKQWLINCVKVFLETETARVKPITIRKCIFKSQN